ncbi:hypothetical protein GOV07_01810 [Candidatus Woesearchaeota archaeon]|nr:hypothetical protein [Candidatus Woesearchaeota archaeon]
MKKLFSILIIAMFVMSMVPLAFAENESEDADPSEEAPPMPPERDREEMQKRIQARNEEMKEHAQQFRESVKERNAQFRENVKERNEQFRENVKDRNEQFRENVKAHIEQARERNEMAKEKYEQARERYKEAQGKVNEAREKWQDCEGDENEACTAAREKIRGNAKPFLGNSADMILQSLERVYAQVAGNENMDPERQEEILDELEEQMAEVEAAKAETEALDDNSTDDEIRDAAEGVRNSWQHTKAKMKRAAAHHAYARLGNIIEKLEHLGERTENAIEKLDANGKDVSKAKELHSEYLRLLAESRSEWELAKQVWEEQKEADEVDAQDSTAREHFQKARELAKEARSKLREVVRAIKAAHGGDLPPVTEVEPEEEEDDDSETGGNKTDSNETA